MWLSWSLLIKDDGYTKKAWRLRACSFGHSWCWRNTVDFDGWLRARSFFIDRNITVGSSYLVHEQDRDIWNGKPLIGWVCAMVCAMAVWHVQTHRLPGSDSNDNSFTSGMDFITPIVTGGSATDFSSFRAVLSFSTSLGKELKNQFFWVSEATVPCSLSFRETSSSDRSSITGCGFPRMGQLRHQAERASKTYHQWVKVTPSPVSLSCLRNFC